MRQKHECCEPQKMGWMIKFEGSRFRLKNINQLKGGLWVVIFFI